MAKKVYLTGGLKMVLIDVNGPGTVALGFFMSFYFSIILFLPYFRFRLILPNLLAISGKIDEVLRAT